MHVYVWGVGDVKLLGCIEADCWGPPPCRVQGEGGDRKKARRNEMFNPGKGIHRSSSLSLHAVSRENSAYPCVLLSPASIHGRMSLGNWGIVDL